MTVRAFMGGTFDPIHYGHLRIADMVRRALGLAELALLPTANPPHKSPGAMTSADHRVAMVRLGLLEFPALTLCTLELTDTVAYTVDTLRALREGPPRIRPVFVVGMDSVGELPTWHAYRELLAEFDMIAIARPHDERAAQPERHPFVADRIREAVDFEAARALIDNEELGRGGRIFPLTLPPQSISSREIRARVARDDELGDLVPRDVALYIRGHGLYREGATP